MQRACQPIHPIAVPCNVDGPGSEHSSGEDEESEEENDPEAESGTEAPAASLAAERRLPALNPDAIAAGVSVAGAKKHKKPGGADTVRQLHNR